MPADRAVLARVRYEFTNAMEPADRKRANLQQLRRFPPGTEGILNYWLHGAMEDGRDGGGDEGEPGGDQDEAARRRGESKQAMFGESAHRDVARE